MPGRVSHLHSPTPGLGAPGVSKDLLPDELIHHVGQVGDDEDDHHSQGQVGHLHLGSGQVAAVHASRKVDTTHATFSLFQTRIFQRIFAADKKNCHFMLIHAEIGENLEKLAKKYADWR